MTVAIHTMSARGASDSWRSLMMNSARTRTSLSTTLLASLVSILVVLLPRDARADHEGPFTLEAAIAFALAHHPALATARAGEDVASAWLSLARADEAPQAGLGYQIN